LKPNKIEKYPFRERKLQMKEEEGEEGIGSERREEFIVLGVG